jgi:DDE superfamily endonuclease
VPRAAARGATAQNTSLHASARATPRVQQARASYRQRIAALALRRLKFVDASGVNLAMTRVYGRAPAGERVIGNVPQHDGQNVTVLGALGVQGLHAVMTVHGATDTEVCRTYVRQVLGPTLTPGDMVVMGNLRAHKAVGVQQAMTLLGKSVTYSHWGILLPPDAESM